MKQIALAVLAVSLAQSQLRAQNTGSDHASAVVVPAGTAKYGAAPGHPFRPAPSWPSSRGIRPERARTR
jgi:hypothetical protein